MRSVFVDRRFPALPTKILAQTEVIYADFKKFTHIICPFLSTLVFEEELYVQQSYSKETLLQATMAQGLSREMAEDHIDDNFAFTPSGWQDIFNYEGAPNEHMTSTG